MLYTVAGCHSVTHIRRSYRLELNRRSGCERWQHEVGKHFEYSITYSNTRVMPLKLAGRPGERFCRLARRDVSSKAELKRRSDQVGTQRVLQSQDNAVGLFSHASGLGVGAYLLHTLQAPPPLKFRPLGVPFLGWFCRSLAHRLRLVCAL